MCNSKNSNKQNKQSKFISKCCKEFSNVRFLTGDYGLLAALVNRILKFKKFKIHLVHRIYDILSLKILCSF